MAKQSRYSEFGYKKPRREKRTIKIQGANDDDGMYYRCWYCGFPGNRIDRNALGDGDGLSYSIVYPFSPGINVGITGNTVLVTSTYHPQVTVKTAGCAFCGCENWK